MAAYEAERSAAARGPNPLTGASGGLKGSWPAGHIPRWLAEFAAFCWREVPIYRGYGTQPASFLDIPTCDRADLSRVPWDFVPDAQPLEGLTVFQTSGTTGHPLNIITHPEVLAHYWPLLRAALAAHGVALEPAGDGGPPASVVVVCFQASTYTYAAISPYLNQAGLAKINLNASDWRDPDDRVRFLEACQPAVISGDPVSLAELARLPVKLSPQALVSTSMALMPGLRRQLEARFGCGVVDLYSMNETGPIAVAAPGGEGHWLLQHRLYVEVLNDDETPCPSGGRGEIVVSGGFNPFLPLLRYRTGDWASLDYSSSGELLLVGLEGRAPVLFHSSDGRIINNIDVTSALKVLALPEYNLHQFANGALRLRVPSSAAVTAAARAELLSLFGPETAVEIETFIPGEAGKRVQYSSELEASSLS